ncbi:MAG: FAD-binding dehydrogenase [Bacteroidota bacterium]
MINQAYQSDIIIVGGGLAGIVAALELLDTGKKVLIIDRDTAANFGGLAKWAFGGMFFVDSKHQRRMGIKDSVDLAMQDWFSFAEFEADEYWGKKWAEQYIHLCTPHSYDWLKTKGLGFFPVLNWVERGLHRPGNSVPRFHMVLGTGWELTYSLIRQLKAHPKAENLSLKFDHRVRSILDENGTIKGVRGTLEQSGQDFEARADIVVVATGGINGSIERVKQNWHKSMGTPPKKILNGAHQYAVGDLHDATEKINGSVVNLDKQWNYAAGIHHYAPRKKDHGLSLVPCKSALWLNYEGRRFGPIPLITAYDTRYLVERICQEPVKYSWQILNMKIAKKEFAISGSEHNELMRDKKVLQFVLKTALVGNEKLMQKIIDNCEDVVIAYSLEELVDKMNAISEEKSVQLKYVREAVEQYDANIDRGPKFHNDEQLRRIAHARQYRGDKVRTCKFQKILDSRAMPLIAMKEYILSRKSLGGIQTNLDSQVLTQADEAGKQAAIEGLYAIGEAAGFGGGGMHGHRSLEGTFLGGCVISARVAAASIKGQRLA